MKVTKNITFIPTGFVVVPGFEERYAISKTGEVWSILRQKIKTSRLCRDGYMYAQLFNGKNIPIAIHRLLAICFILNPENKPQVNHLDGIKSNNALSNLEWVTSSENLNHAFRIGLKDPKTQGRLSGDNALSKQIAQLTKEGVLVKIWPSMMDARRSGFNQSAIYLACRGKLKHHAGYKWQYINQEQWHIKYQNS